MGQEAKAGKPDQEPFWWSPRQAGQAGFGSASLDNFRGAEVQGLSWVLGTCPGGIRQEPAAECVSPGEPWEPQGRVWGASSGKRALHVEGLLAGVLCRRWGLASPGKDSPPTSEATGVRA